MNKNQMKTNKKSQSLTYNDIEHIVEYLVKVKSHTYTFDCWTTDDIGQEIRLICFKMLEHFDFERTQPDKWKNFFGRCVDNALKNLKRDMYIRFQPPCSSDCALLHSDDKQLSKICKKWLRHQSNITKKRNIKHPVSIELVGDIKDVKFEKRIEVEDTKKYLIDNIEPGLRSGLIHILRGDKKQVPIKERREIQVSVKALLED